MQIEIEKVDKTDVRLPIKTYIVDTNERRLHSEPHIHNEIEIIYMMNGSMEFVVEDQQTVVNAGDIIIINSMTAHWSNKLNIEEYSRIH